MNRITEDAVEQTALAWLENLGYKIGHGDGSFLRKARDVWTCWTAWTDVAGGLDGWAEFLARTRDTLLPKLISGELRVPDTEKFIEENVL